MSTESMVTQAADALCDICCRPKARHIGRDLQCPETVYFREMPPTTAAQPEREAVLEGAVVAEIERIVRVAMQDEFLSGSDWSDGRVRKRTARARSATRDIIAALTTPAPAEPTPVGDVVSTDEICAHSWRSSDSSLYDFKCTKCGETE